MTSSAPPCSRLWSWPTPALWGGPCNALEPGCLPSGKIRSALFGANNPRVLPTRMLDGAADVWEGRIRLWGADLWVQDVDFPAKSGPSRDRGDGALVFRPRTSI